MDICWFIFYDGDYWRFLQLERTHCRERARRHSGKAVLFTKSPCKAARGKAGERRKGRPSEERRGTAQGEAGCRHREQTWKGEMKELLADGFDFLMKCEARSPAWGGGNGGDRGVWGEENMCEGAIWRDRANI